MTLNEFIGRLQEVAAVGAAGDADVYAVAAAELGDFDVDLSEITYERGRVWIGINAAPEGTADKLAAPAVGGVQ